MKEREYFQDLSVCKENRLDGHSTCSLYESVSEYEAGQETAALMLDGQWRFEYISDVEELPTDFYQSGYDDTKWRDISVPGSWESQGIGLDEMEDQTCGLYRKTFDLETSWVDEVVIADFSQVKSAFYVWLNGSYVGYSESAMMSSEFDISAYVVEGENVLALQVLSQTVTSSIEAFDRHVGSGITGSVSIQKRPETYIHDVYARTEFDGSYDKALLKVSVDIRNVLSERIPLKIRLYLTQEGTNALEPLTEGRMVAEETGRTKVLLEVAVESPMLWHADNPSRYTLLTVLSDHLDHPIESSVMEIGFRDMNIIDGGLAVNGERTVLCGIEYWCSDGAGNVYTGAAEIEKDIIRLKENGINAVRTPHYPLPSCFYELCDKYGLYVIDEAPVSGAKHRHRNVPGVKKQWHDTLCDRGVRMVLRDRNHPCVVAWSLGHDAGDGPQYVAMKKAMLEMDMTRPYYHEADMEGVTNDLVDACLLMDFAYAGSNALGGLTGYRNVLYGEGKCQGGFVDGAVIAFENHPGLPEVKKLYQRFDIECDLEAGTYEILSRSCLHDEVYDIAVIYIEDGETVDESITNDVKFAGGRYSGKSKLLLKKDLDEADQHVIIEVRVAEDCSWCEKGHEVAFEQFDIGTKPVLLNEVVSEGECLVENREEALVVTGDEVRYFIDRKNGAISQIVYKGKNLLIEPLRPNFYRKAVINDDEDTFYLEAGLEMKVRAFDYEQTDQYVEIRISGKMKGFKGLFEMTYRCSNQGEISVFYKGMPSRDPYRFGATMSVNRELSQVSYFGKGPHENYVDRSDGAKTMIHHLSLPSMSRLFERNEESGNRTDVRWMTVTGEDGIGFMMEKVGEDNLECSVWPYTMNNLINAEVSALAEGNNVTTVNIDHMQQNIGGDYPDTYHDSREKRLYGGQTYAYEFKLILIADDM